MSQRSHAAATRLARKVTRARGIRPGALSRIRSASVAPTLSAGGTPLQRVVVKLSFKRHDRGARRGQKLRAHIDYIARESATGEARTCAFFDQNRDALDARDVVSEWSKDRHHFRLIVSPEQAHKLPDMRAYVRGTVERLERHLGTRLDWRAVAHTNTDNPHAHVVIRGVRDDGSDLVIDKTTWSHRLRELAQEEATAWLGERSLWQRERQIQRDLGEMGWTRIDGLIERLAGDERKLDVGPGFRHLSCRREHVVGRLIHLEQIGLAHRPRPLAAPFRWELAEEFSGKLRALGERRDLIVMVRSELRTRAGQAYWFEPQSAASMRTTEGRVTGAGPSTWSAEQAWVGVEDGKGGVAIHYVKRKWLKELQVGQTVRLSYDASASKRPPTARLQIVRERWQGRDEERGTSR